MPLIAEGTAIINVNIVKTDPRNGFIPDINIWCAQTTNESAPMPKIE